MLKSHRQHVWLTDWSGKPFKCQFISLKIDDDKTEFPTVSFFQSIDMIQKTNKKRGQSQACVI